MTHIVLHLSIGWSVGQSVDQSMSAQSFDPFATKFVKLDTMDTTMRVDDPIFHVT